jgi:hypothetical protein
MAMNGINEICAGCAIRGQMAGSVTSKNGHRGYVCAKCVQRSCDDEVFRLTVERCIASGSTKPETEAVFAKLGMEMPTTEPGVRRVVAELIRRFEADTGLPGPSIDDALRAMVGAAR